MKLQLFLSLATVLTWPVQGENRCPQYWVDATDFKMGCLWFNFKTSMNWENAQEYCRTINITVTKQSHLVEIYSMEQQHFLERKFIEFDFIYGIVHDWWTGLTDDLFEGRWLWSFSLLPANYTFWYTGRPIQDNRYNYVVIRSGYEYTWYDNSGSSSYYPICQFLPDE